MRRLIVILCLLSAMASAQIRGPHRKVFAATPAGCGAVGNPCTDDFNRAALGTNWTKIGSTAVWSIYNSTELQIAAGTAPEMLVYSAGTIGDNQFSETAITSIPASGYLGPAARVSAVDTYYAVRCNATSGYCYWRGRLHGVLSSFDDNNFAYAITVGDVLTLEVSGNTVTFKVNGVVKSTKTDTTNTITGGLPGFYIHNSATTWRVDNWRGGAL